MRWRGGLGLVGLVQRVEPTVLQRCLFVNYMQVDDAAPEPGRSLEALSRRRRACRHCPIAVPSAMIKISYSGYPFPPEIIQHAIWLYIRFTLSFRDVEDLLAERGIMVEAQPSILVCSLI